jgi:protocatechuate 3,4-dioxygenase beta subunit
MKAMRIASKAIAAPVAAHPPSGRSLVMEDGLAQVLAQQQMSCRLWPEQIEGPYRRNLPPERRDITEGREGAALRIGLRLVDAETGGPLSGARIEVWQADHEGRYSGFPPPPTGPGQAVTSASVSREVAASSETFLRGCQRTDHHGMCSFDTIYPGWYPGRTAHIHLALDLEDRHAVTQLYFDDELTDEVLDRPPYAARSPRDTTNATDSIFAEGGERTVLNVTGDPLGPMTGVLCLGLEPHLTA